MLLCAGSWLCVCCFWPWFFEKTKCYTVMVLYCTRVHQLDVYCHSTVLLLFWILYYLCMKENVIVWLLLFGRFRVKLKGFVELCPGLVFAETSSYCTQNPTDNFSLHTTRCSHAPPPWTEKDHFLSDVPVCQLALSFPVCFHEGESIISTWYFLTPSRKE